MTTLWIRADASTASGLGHVMRTMALAEVAREHGHGVEYVVPEQRWVVQLVERRGFSATTAAGPADERWLEDVRQRDGVVFDGYGFSAAHHRSAGARAAAVAVIDDIGRGTYDVDVLVNPNPVPATAYRVGRRTRLLIGPRYALLRAEFRAPPPPRSDSGTLLLTFGGSDPAGLGRRATELLDTWRPFQRVRLVVGPGGRAQDVPGRPWLETVYDPAAPAEAFRAADAAVSAAGSTTWELLSLGVPVALVQVAENQRVVVEGAVSAGAALSAGTPDDLVDMLPRALQQLAEPAVRRRLVAAGHELVDGHGAERVLTALLA